MKMKLFDYIRGNRRGREAHRTELEAMRDPMLRDALEGFDSVEGDHGETVRRLQAKISGSSPAGAVRAAKLGNRRRIWMGTAAGILLCASIGGLYWLSGELNRQPFTLTAKLDPKDLYIEKDGVQVLSKKAAYMPPGARYDSKPDLFADRSIPNIQIDPVVVTGRRTDRVLAIADEAGRADDTNRIIDVLAAVAPENKEAAAEIAMDMAAAAKPAAGKQEERAQLISQNTPSPSEMRATAKRISMLSGNIKGRVSDAAGNPVAGAYVTVKGSDKKAITDSGGTFCLAGLPDSLELLISSAGYEDAVVRGTSDTLPLSIALNKYYRQPDEVVVLGYGTQNKTTVIGAATGGENKDLKKFYKYVSGNLRPQKDGSGNEIKGVVVVEFYMDLKGRPYNIRITESLAPEADSEAIRLIKESPRWTYSMEKQTVRIEF